MRHENTKKIIWAGLFTALVVIATSAIKIPTGNGYLNPGDALVLLSAFFLGPVWGAVASGVGSALADVLSGYAFYAPATLVIKALMALIAGLFFRRTQGKITAARAICGSVLAEVIMISGYFLYDAIFLGFGLAAAVDIPGNIFQGIFGAAAGCFLYFSMIRIPYVRDNF